MDRRHSKDMNVIYDRDIVPGDFVKKTEKSNFVLVIGQSLLLLKSHFVQTSLN